MKKICIIIFSLLSLAVYSQKPFKIHNPDVRFLWGADSMRFLISKRSFYVGDTLVFSDGTKQWSADSLSPGSEFWKLTLDKLEPKISTNYINTDSSYYLKGIEFIKANHNLGNQFIGVGSGANNIVDSINYPLGSLNTANGAYSLYSNTTGAANIANGAESLYSNTTGSSNVANGYQSLYSNTTGAANVAIGIQSLYSNTTGYYNIANGYQSLYSNTTGEHNIANGAESLYSNTTGTGNIAIGYKSGQYADTAANGLLWIGEGDYNNAIIYGNMLTDSLRLNANVNVGTNLMVNQSATIGTNLTVHGDIANGGLINKDTVLILADDETFEFPTTSVGWAEIQCDSSLIEKTWGVVSWNGDGSTSLRSNGAKFVNTDIDGNYACFYDGGVYAILKNTSGYTLTYSIKYHYHN